MEQDMANEKFLEMMRTAAKKMLEEEALRKPVDWDARREWWMEKLEALYSSVEEWMAPLTTDGTFILKRIEKTIKEEALGHYKTTRLEIALGSSKIILEPIGSIIIGAFGRVDVSGPNGKTRLILTTPRDSDVGNYKQNATWHVADSDNKLTLVQLDGPEFLRVIGRLFDLNRAP